ncbi:glycosyltransferase family 2 protein [Vibrio vulnificus]|uniref:glycosyltransferase family 2 protein n=1 Tax=Vibrio vulnificus TaxID=672 RepID=UPI0024E010E1|nr:glycosyltransferase family 2 protein [Vibrio vulnificus]MDK2725758.1 glycosyltransferase family 2 protein [Vibrio vulnificus]
MFFSIIIPAYNAEEYIERCLDSVINQLYNDYEIIVINDGSTDSTVEVIEGKYLKPGSECNVKLFTIENSGVSNARNAGLRKAKGEYVIFLDSDDWIQPESLFTLYQNIITSNCDILILNYLINWGDGKIKKSSFIKKEETISSECAINYFVSGKISNSPWDKVFRRSIVSDNNLEFPKYIKMGEDAVFVSRFLLHAKKICLIDMAIVNYMQNTAGVTKSPNVQHLYQLDLALQLIIDSYSSIVDYNKLQLFYLCQMTNLARHIENSALIESGLYSKIVNSYKILKCRFFPSLRYIRMSVFLFMIIFKRILK